MRAQMLMTVLAVAACHPAANGGETPAPLVGPVTVTEVIATPEVVGQPVSVTGYCLGDPSAVNTKERPPESRPAWLLEDEGRAIWVVGSVPASCGTTALSATPVKVQGVVRQDTVPVPNGHLGRVRRYLVRR